jgi:hypothetical protein
MSTRPGRLARLRARDQPPHAIEQVWMFAVAEATIG